MQFVRGTKGRDVADALQKSNCDMAEAQRQCKTFIATHKSGGIRIIKDVTDPTVVRRLRPSDDDLAWYAINDLDGDKS